MTNITDVEFGLYIGPLIYTNCCNNIKYWRINYKFSRFKCDYSDFVKLVENSRIKNSNDEYECNPYYKTWEISTININDPNLYLFYKIKEGIWFNKTYI
jgi:hypothetical protein